MRAINLVDEEPFDLVHFLFDASVQILILLVNKQRTYLFCSFCLPPHAHDLLTNRLHNDPHVTCSPFFFSVAQKPTLPRGSETHVEQKRFLSCVFFQHSCTTPRYVGCHVLCLGIFNHCTVIGQGTMVSVP